MSFNAYDFEKYPPGMAMDETDVNLRGYIAGFSDEKVAQYDPSWSDEQVMDWEENFTDEGTVFLVCSERDVEVEEYRKVLEQFIEFRKQAGVAV